ncbi:cupin domain-containing protein [Enterococcus rivorum]|nr:cupin domain-containing protein [Enterococcus rivorum]MBP2100390.1 putative cupin superfamily sugar epimerase [Enterococcus rivorum]
MENLDYEYYFNMVERLNEGGYVSEEYFSEVLIPEDALPSDYQGNRPAASMIYYLLKPEDVSKWHTVRSDEIWIWRAGGSVELTLGGVGETPEVEKTIILGGNLSKGELPHLLVKGGQWQTARPVSQQDVLVNCIVVPGFREADYREGENV